MGLFTMIGSRLRGCVAFLGLAILPILTIAQSDVPTGLSGAGYDSHVELRWDQSPDPGLVGYNIYRADSEAGSFELVGFADNIRPIHIDFLGRQDTEKFYRITALNNAGQESEPTSGIAVATFEMTDEQLLTMVQEYTFRYFWDFAHPVSGLARERNTTSTVTTGGSGFGVMAILVGIEQGFITRAQGLERLTKIVSFLEEDADRFKGVFPHWMNGSTGNVVPFSPLDDGGDLVETAFMIQGLLTVRQYFDAATAEETSLRDKITGIWESVNWNWYRKQVDNVLYWHWSPTHNFAINHQLRGFNEVHIAYILAIASPIASFRVPPSLYHTGWAGGDYENGNTYYGYKLDVGPFRGGPLFFAHYSYLGFDPRNKRDQYTNYFNRNKIHSLINRAHAVENPYDHAGYSGDCWGLTASDDPLVGYLAHSPENPTRDNGTIAPTAAIGSMPYTPAFSISALRHFYRDHGDRLWGEFGFYDAFNLDQDWFADSYLAIDQGPIICMIENYRSGLLWDLFMSNPEIAPALDAIGFTPDSTVVVAGHDLDPAAVSFRVFPNPTNEDIQLEMSLEQRGATTIRLYNAGGRAIRTLFAGQQLSAGLHRFSFSLQGVPAGLYFLRAQTNGTSFDQKLIITDY